MEYNSNWSALASSKQRERTSPVSVLMMRFGYWTTIELVPHSVNGSVARPHSTTSRSLRGTQVPPPHSEQYSYSRRGVGAESRSHFMVHWSPSFAHPEHVSSPQAMTTP